MDILNNIVLILQRYWDLFLEGIGVTLLLSAIAVGCGVIIGSLLALMPPEQVAHRQGAPA